MSISIVQVSYWHAIPNFRSNEINLVNNQVSGVYIWVQSGEYSQSQYIMNSSLLLLLCQRTPIATCNRCIPYYAYYTCQSGSYVIWNWLAGDIICVLSGSRTYLRPRPRLLALNHTLPQGSQVTCITSQVTSITCINRNKNRNRTECQSPYKNPAMEPSFGSATYILSPPKIQTLSPPSVFSIPV